MQHHSLADAEAHALDAVWVEADFVELGGVFLHVIIYLLIDCVVNFFFGFDVLIYFLNIRVQRIAFADDADASDCGGFGGLVLINFRSLFLVFGEV